MFMYQSSWIIKRAISDEWVPPNFLFSMYFIIADYKAENRQISVICIIKLIGIILLVIFSMPKFIVQMGSIIHVQSENSQLSQLLIGILQFEDNTVKKFILIKRSILTEGD